MDRLKFFPLRRVTANVVRRLLAPRRAKVDRSIVACYRSINTDRYALVNIYYAGRSE